jgi:secreted trypsin-like serine protease
MAEYDNHYYLIGIVATGIAGCGNTSTLYVRARAFIDWICENHSNIAYCSTMNNMTSPSSSTSTPTTTLYNTPTTTMKNDDRNKITIIIVATVVPAGILGIGALIVYLYFSKRS